MTTHRGPSPVTLTRRRWLLVSTALPWIAMRAAAAEAGHFQVMATYGGPVGGGVGASREG